jgi:hypothetical protein
MREPDEAAGVIALGLPHPVIDQAAGSEIRLIEASPARQHRQIDSRVVHHAHMRGKIGQQRIELVIWIAMLIEAQNAGVTALHQLGRRIVVLKINDHHMLLT